MLRVFTYLLCSTSLPSLYKLPAVFPKALNTSRARFSPDFMLLVHAFLLRLKAPPITARLFTSLTSLPLPPAPRVSALCFHLLPRVSEQFRLVGHSPSPFPSSVHAVPLGQRRRVAPLFYNAGPLEGPTKERKGLRCSLLPFFAPLGAPLSPFAVAD